MNSQDDLANIFINNRTLAELNPDIAAETLAGKNSRIRGSVAKRKPQQGNAAPESSEPAQPQAALNGVIIYFATPLGTK